jgi:ABC-2 type transport system permease protein
MLRGLWQLTWLEIKIFVREPLGVIGTVAVPVVFFVALGKMFGGPLAAEVEDAPNVVTVDLPILASMLIALSAVLSLVTIVSIYREGGILKRLRATPLRPYTILSAHVIVKLLLTAVTFGATMLIGRRYYPLGGDVPVVAFTLALMFTTVSILSIGFLIASVVPTARFAQPIGSIILYPMLGLSGLFMPIDTLPPVLQAAARVLPLTYAVSLLKGIWNGDGWIAHGGDAVVLALVFVVCTGLSAKVFRWE